MPAIKVSVNGDGSGFARTMQGVEKRVHGLSSSLNGTFKNQLAGLFGAAAIGMVVKNMADFASEIQDASDRLGIATDRVQELRAAAKHAGKDLGFFDTVFRNIEKSASLAIGGDTKKAGIFKRLGVTDDELRHLNKSDLLAKALKGTEGMDRTVADSLISGITGPKNGGQLMGMKDEILNAPDINIVSSDDLAALDEAQDKWEDIVLSLKVSLIPALITVAEWIMTFCHNLMQGFKVAFAYVEGLINNIKSFSVKNGVKGYVSASRDVNSGVLRNIWAFLTRKQGVKDTFNGIWDSFAGGAKATLGGFVGKEAVKAAEDAAVTMGQVVDEEDKARQARIDKKIADSKARQDALRGPVNREATPTGTKVTKSPLDAELKGGSSNLKIGGLLGVDANYRLERLSAEANKWLKVIAQNTQPDTNDNEFSEGGFTN